MINFDEMLNGDKENGTVGIFDYSEEEQEYEEELEYGEELEDDLNDNQIEKLLNKKYEQDERLTSEEVELKVLEYKNGNLKAFDDIYNFYYPIIKKWGIRNRNEEMAIEIIDCILLKALKEFDVTKKNKFNTLFWTYIKTAIKRELQSKNCKKRIGDFKKVSLNKMISSKKSGNDTYELEKRIKSNTFDRDYLDAESNQIIDKFSKFFNEKEKFIIKNIIKGKNTSDISKMLDITPAAVSSNLRRIAQKYYANDLYKALKNEL